MPDLVDGKVTMAVLGTKLDNITNLLSTHIDNNKGDHDRYDLKIQRLEVNVAKMETKQTTLAYIQVVVSAALSSVAAYLGIR